MTILDASDLDTPPASRDFNQRAFTNFPEPRTLDKARYTSRAFLMLEREKMWRRAWQMACRESEVANPGDYLEFETAGESLLITRDQAGQLHALSNVCRHRATHLKRDGAGNSADLRCPFHGWNYGLDGKLTELPNDWDFPHVDKARTCLPEFRLETWKGFVFVNLDPDAEPLADHLGGLVEAFEPFDYENYYRFFGIRIVIPCNWKLNYHAFIESYHSPWTHPTTLSNVNEALTEYDIVGRHGRMIVHSSPSPQLKPAMDEVTLMETLLEQRPVFGAAQFDADQVLDEVKAGKSVRQVLLELRKLDAQARGLDISRLNEAQIVDNESYNIFPNMILFSSMIGMGFYSRLGPNGDDPDSSIMEVNIMAPVPAGAERPKDAPHKMITAEDVLSELPGIGVLFDQDVRNLRTVQRGLKSQSFPNLILGLYQESLPRHMEDVLDEYLARP